MSTTMTLFDVAPMLPQGFEYYPNFLTRAEETELATGIRKFDLQTMKFHQSSQKKSYKFWKGMNLPTNNLLGNSIPILFDPLIDRIVAKLLIKRKTSHNYLLLHIRPVLLSTGTGMHRRLILSQASHYLQIANLN